MSYRITSYNIENMRQRFKKNRVLEEFEKSIEAAASTLCETSPHIAGIIEGSDRLGDHETFLKYGCLSKFNFKIAKSNHRRGRQDLLFYYREPFEVVSIDENIQFYKEWIEDIDHDTIPEVLRFERKPLEVVFKNTLTGNQVLIILVSFKSKGVFSTTDIHQYEHIAIANRKKLYGQAKKVRERLETLLDDCLDMPIMVMGDLNDEPGYDHFEKMLGASAIETIMGSLYNPKNILHNALWHHVEAGKKHEIWTTEYPDPIVDNFSKHKAWLDHIFVSQCMIKQESSVQLVKDSGSIADKTDEAKLASDHFPVYCDIEM